MSSTSGDNAMHTSEPVGGEPSADKPSTKRRRAASKKIKGQSNGKPASAVETVGASLAGGDLAADIQLTADAKKLSAGDQRALRELGALARSMRRTVSRLQRAADSIESIAQRVLEGG